jgi:hypothetical protein
MVVAAKCRRSWLAGGAGEHEVLVAVARAGGMSQEPLALGLSLEGADDALGQADPGVTGTGLGCGEHRCGVVDVGQGVADEQHASV